MNEPGLVSLLAAEGLPPGYRMHGVPDEGLTGEKGSAKNPLTATLGLHRGCLFGWKLERCCALGSVIVVRLALLSMRPVGRPVERDQPS